MKKADIINAQAASALIEARDEKVELISELIKVTGKLLTIQGERKNVISHAQSPKNKKQKMITTASDHF